MSLILVALGLLVASSVLGLVLARQPRLSSAILTGGGVGACVAGVLGALGPMTGAAAVEWRLPVALAFGQPVVGLDVLSAFFLLPLFALSALLVVYGPAYLRAHDPDRRVAWPGAVFNLLVAAMVLVLVARDGILLLVAWEVMTVSSYLLVTLEHEQGEVRRAGFVYLVAGHVGVVALFFLMLLLGSKAGSLELSAFAHLAPPTRAGGVVIVVLAFVGFGVKAGLVPMHVWLPEAHAAAPTHVSALMSGVLVKLGIYGILRVLGLLPVAGWWGPALIVMGFAGALLGITHALYQRDLKRVLAYSTIENVGLVLIGLGLGYWGVVAHEPYLAAVGFAAGLLHLWNHVAMKGLMFLSAGSVVAATGTRDLERLGGLARKLPVTAVGLVGGAVAISALPPLAGFTGEWLLYLGLIHGGLSRDGATGTLALLAVGLLALVGGLAALCFARLVGVVLLGNPRAELPGPVHEPGAPVLGPIGVLVGVVALLGVVPGLALGPVARVVATLAPPEVAAQLGSVAGSLRNLGIMSVVVWAVLGASTLLVLRTRRAAKDETWGCGYVAPTARMQYTGASFSEYGVRRLLPAWLGPRRSLPTARPGAFASPAEAHSTYDDPFTRALYQPFLERWAARLTRLHWIQQGILHVYFLYIFVVVVLAFAWLALRAWMGT